VNAAHARYLEVRRLLLIGRLDEGERTLAELDPRPSRPRRGGVAGTLVPVMAPPAPVLAGCVGWNTGRCHGLTDVAPAVDKKRPEHEN